MRAFASEQAQVSSAVHELPGTLSQTTDTLDRVGAMARILRPTAQNLRPAARNLDAANKSVLPLASETTPRLRDDIRPFVREARPLARDLRPTAERLSSAMPDLTQDVSRLNRFFNLLAYNPNGKEGRRQGRPPGGLPVLAGLGRPHGQPALLELGRERHVPPGDAGGHVRDGPGDRQGGAAARVPLMLTPILADSAACAK